ncbi:stress-sensitive restriction system protein [Neisseria gonorrhoeae]|uniref:Stress-sensitive restriction system protein n=1 Tax=Neisseria gonorrhoeae TaxID=485 RepID=A0A378W108_NEIGO|nr:stress-sensitive restriction system protein [Neisseria gonorrhoeae]
MQAVNNGEDLAGSFKESYLDLQKTKPDIHHFDEIYEKLTALLENKQISTLVVNSQTETDFDLEKGFNIIIGGNVIGRGLTIPKLQTVYSSRTAKKPNADTFWQHSRILDMTAINHYYGFIFRLMSITSLYNSIKQII